jgi:hypothetical protein
VPTGGVLDITATIGDRSVLRAEVLEWEERRAAVVFKRLGLGATPDDVAAARAALVAKKLELGHAEIERRLARQMAMAARSSRLMSALSRGGRRLCTVELRGSGGTAEAVPAFYQAAMDAGDEAPLLAAAPDHWVLRKRGGGVQQVIETTGGSPSGALRHQFRDESGGGFTARLTIEFPRATPARLVDAHRWHLACEFSNWIEAANA